MSIVLPFRSHRCPPAENGLPSCLSSGYIFRARASKQYLRKKNMGARVHHPWQPHRHKSDFLTNATRWRIFEARLIIQKPITASYPTLPQHHLQKCNHIDSDSFWHPHCTERIGAYRNKEENGLICFACSAGRYFRKLLCVASWPNYILRGTKVCLQNTNCLYCNLECQNTFTLIGWEVVHMLYTDNAKDRTSPLF